MAYRVASPAAPRSITAKNHTKRTGTPYGGQSRKVHPQTSFSLRTQGPGPPIEPSSQSTFGANGGGATWTAHQFGTGTLGLSDCVLRGITVNGTLSGLLESGSVQVDAQMAGPASVSGAFSGQLNLTQLLLTANTPTPDDTAYWEVRATDANDKMLCAWSGGSGCGPTPPL